MVLSYQPNKLTFDSSHYLALFSTVDNFELSNERAFMSIAASWYINQNKILVGQSKEFEKNSRIFVDREQPLIPAISVKEEEIKAQENRIQELRKEIKQALQELEEMDDIDSLLQANIHTAAKNDATSSSSEDQKMSIDSIKTEQPIVVDA